MRAGARHALVLGCGRSGTSILGELFEHVEGYAYHSEPPYAALAALDRSRLHAVKVPRESEGFPPSRGLSFPYEDLGRAMPAPLRVFWIVRHPLDAICSLRVGIASGWGHHPRPPDWRDWLDRPLLERCAHHWATINEHGYARVRDDAHLVRFESMIADPRRFAAEICEQAGLDPAGHAAALDAWSRRVQDTNNADFVEAKTSRAYSRPDHAVRVGRWRENLDAAEVARVIPIVEKAARRLGYAVPA